MPTLSERDAAAVGDAVAGGYVGSGNTVREFEREIAARLSRHSAHATTTGSAALHLALLAVGVLPGDKVLVPAFVCRAVLNVVLACGARPVLVDIDPETLCITAEYTRDAMRRAAIPQTERTVLVLVHSFGLAADIASFEPLGVVIVEDAASSFGASYEGKPVGSAGVVSVISFASTKMMTTGQGGMVLTSDESIDQRISALMDYDSIGKSSRDFAFNYGFTEMQAALGLSQLSRLDDFVKSRTRIAAAYSDKLQRMDHVIVPGVRSGSSWYRYVLRSERAEPAVDRLRALGIDARTSVSHFIGDYIGQPGLPGTEAVRNRILSLPIYPSLTDVQVERIGSAAREVLQST